MKTVIYGAAALALSLTAAQAQSMNKTDNGNAKGPGTVGAMQNSTADGVATDSAQVKAQEGRTAKAAPGTVGAAPGANTPSENPNH